MRRAKPKNWTLQFKGKIEDFDSLSSLDYWLKRSPREKFLEVENLISQAQKIRGKSRSDESRLLRSTAVLKRQ